MTKEQLKNIIRNIPDFPIKGIQFKDIMPLLGNPEAFQFVINEFSEFIRKCGATAVIAPEARGFIFGAPIAYKLGIKFVPARKKGKLPYKTYEVSYGLEYGDDVLQIHHDALIKTDKVVIIDDLIATAGTVSACIDLVKKSSASIVGIASLISLETHHFVDDNKNKIPLYEILKF